jgi:hypothetical protein
MDLSGHMKKLRPRIPSLRSIEGESGSGKEVGGAGDPSAQRAARL